MGPWVCFAIRLGDGRVGSFCAGARTGTAWAAVGVAANSGGYCRPWDVLASLGERSFSDRRQ